MEGRFYSPPSVTKNIFDWVDLGFIEITVYVEVAFGNKAHGVRIGFWVMQNAPASEYIVNKV